MPGSTATAHGTSAWPRRRASRRCLGARRRTGCFGETAQPHEFIDDQLVIARFTVSRRIDKSQLRFNPAIGIDPEIKEQARFRLSGSKVSLHERMTMGGLFVRNDLENMALFAGMTPPGGFETFVPTAGDDETGLTAGRPPGGCTRTSSARR